MSTSILIIEKDDPDLKLMEWGLRQDGFQVTSVAEPHIPGDIRPDVIVMNTGMPAASKRAWIESLRYLVPGVKVIDLRANANPDSAADTGADAYLQEPYLLDNLSALMATVLGRDLGNTPNAWPTFD